MAPVQRVEGGWRVTTAAITGIVGLIAIGSFFVTVTAAAVGARQQLANSTPIEKHEALVGRHDSLVSAVRDNRAAIDTLKGQLLGLSCHQAGYPAPFCNGVPRVVQTGSPP